MAIGIVCIVIGIALFMTGSFGVTNILQQTVQYLMFVCSAIFFVGGFILIELNEIIKKIASMQEMIKKENGGMAEINPPLNERIEK